MTEIRVDVDLAHPPERVWHAMTEARVVLGWLPTAHFMVTDDNRFTFRAADLPGLDEQINGQIVTSDPPYRLVARWEAPNLNTLLSVTLQPTETGCRFTLAQRGFLGAQGTMRRRVLHRTYTELFNGPLKEALDRLAAEEEAPVAVPSRVENGRRNDGRAFQRLPRQETPRSASAPGLTSYVRAAAGPKHAVAMPGLAAAVLVAQARSVGVARVDPAPPRPAVRRFGRLLAAGWGYVRAMPGWSAERRSQAVAAGAAALLLIAMVALLVGRSTVGRPPDPPQVGGAEPGPFQASVPALPSVEPTARATAGAGGPVATGSAVPSDISGSSTSNTALRSAAAPATLSAAYKTESVRVSGYDATITIQNPTGRPVQDWTVKLTLRVLDLGVHDVEGATATMGNNEVTFTPVDATREVGAGSSIKVKFRVDGLGRPTACSIEGQPCAGIPE